ncbi:MAG: glycosyltransferase [Nitrospinota bacterium]|nr:glycosyltransferase [Nitrospinota bacterium]
MRKEKYYIVLVSMHGLVHGSHMELGRDSDTGGQIKYVVELAQALARHPDVDTVDLVTRKIIDSRVSPDYAVGYEKISPGFNIVRLPCGPNRYLRKEVLWPYMSNFADSIIEYLRNNRRMPDFIHGHYADAGYVCSYVSGLLGVPMAFTGHSLGKVKEQRLLEQGMKAESIEKNFNIKRRIEAEEISIENASFVVTSTRQEVEEQYRVYANYARKRMLVIPPGVDVSKYKTVSQVKDNDKTLERNIFKFFSDPKKPMILALSRPDAKKNILGLVTAFGETKGLRDRANLLLVLGTREDIRLMEKSQRVIFNDLLLLIDYYDLWGCVGIPKNHEPDDVQKIYRLAARTNGIFINPAITEPFGLTLLEAASSGLPVIATKNGGAKEIVATCKNGMLIDPFDTSDIGKAMMASLSDKKRRGRWVKAGLVNVKKHYSWDGHVEKYLRHVQRAINANERKVRIETTNSRRLITADRILVCDIDNTLVGDKPSLDRLLKMLNEEERKVIFGVATGRSLKLTMSVLKEWNIPVPNLLITSVGSEIYYGRRLVKDSGYERNIAYRWNPEVIREKMKNLPGIKPQGPKGQGHYKISYFMDPAKAPPISDLYMMLRKNNAHAKLVFSHGMYLDVLPLRASKGLAIRYLAVKWGLSVESILVAGDSGNDEDMLSGNTLGVVVGNHSPELEKLRGEPNIYFARGENAEGIIEAIDYYNFFGEKPGPSMEDIKSG